MTSTMTSGKCFGYFLRIPGLTMRRFHVYDIVVQPVASGVSIHLNLQYQSPWSFFNGTWQKRPGELDHRLRFENHEMTLQCNKLYYDTYVHIDIYIYMLFRSRWQKSPEFLRDFFQKSPTNLNMGITQIMVLNIVQNWIFVPVLLKQPATTYNHRFSNFWILLNSSTCLLRVCEYPGSQNY